MTDVVHSAGVQPGRVRRVYYGVDPTRFHAQPDPAAARGALGLDLATPIVLFVGALGDRRKNFDTLFAAWCTLCRQPGWDARLLVAGSGAELRAWQARAAQTAEVANRISFLGYRTDVPALVAAADVLVHPARYEAYGLAVHEALCCGVPAIAPVAAGVAEQFPDYLRPLLVEDVDSATEVSNRLRKWRDERDRFKERALRFSGTLRARTWDDMAREFAGVVES